MGGSGLSFKEVGPTLKIMLKDAKWIVQTLKGAGFLAFFAGGWVRDYLLKHPSDDIDIATNASPEEVIALFEHTIPIGRAFGVVLIMVNGLGYEVASFRKDDLYLDGRRPQSILYSTPEEDAKRRDFTINGLFFDPIEEKIYDFVGGVEDIERRVIRAIGDPYARFHEDRLRMIRAVRFSVKFGFSMDEKTELAIRDYSSTLYPSVSKERVFQELKKMGGHSTFPHALLELKRLSLFNTIFPLLKENTFEEMQTIIHPLKSLSPGVSFLLILSALFAHCQEEEVMTLFEELRLSNQEKLDLLFGFFCQNLLKKGGGEVTSEEWVLFFSHPLHSMGGQLLMSMSSSFTPELLREKSEELALPIDRKRRGVTLLGSQDLMKAGVTPGKKMGILLREGEKFAIEHHLKTSEEVLERLKKSAAWFL